MNCITFYTKYYEYRRNYLQTNASVYINNYNTSANRLCNMSIIALLTIYWILNSINQIIQITNEENNNHN